MVHLHQDVSSMTYSRGCHSVPRCQALVSSRTVHSRQGRMHYRTFGHSLNLFCFCFSEMSLAHASGSYHLLHLLCRSIGRHLKIRVICGCSQEVFCEDQPELRRPSKVTTCSMSSGYSDWPESLPHLSRLASLALCLLDHHEHGCKL